MSEQLHSVAYQRMRANATRGFWLVKDPCGMICASMTWGLVGYALFCGVTCVLMATPSDAFRVIYAPLFVALVFLGLASHLRAMLTDPGCVPLGNATRENLIRAGFQPGQVVNKCEKCSSIKPERAHHCSICKRCVRKMDHHCPWVNNCVGEGNQKFFMLFTLYISAASWLCLLMTAHHVVICMPSNFHSCSYYFSPPATTGLMVFLVVESLLFGLFTAFMLCDQVCSVAKAESAIDRLKRRRAAQSHVEAANESSPPPKNTLTQNLRSVCGSRPSILWLSPFTRERILPSGNEMVYGELDAESDAEALVNAV